MRPAELPPTTSIDAALTAVTGTSVHVESAVRLEPWSVMRCHLAEPLPGGATSVIAKWVRIADDGTGRTEPARLRTERAALEFVAAHAPRLVPRVLSGRDDGDLLLLEDLAPRESLRELLVRSGPAAGRQPLIDFARALARLHATTSGHIGDYYERLGASPSAGVAVDVVASIGQWEAGVELLRAAGFPMSTAAAHELAGVVDGLLHPGSFLALSNGDPETNNYLTDGSDGRLIDFESAAFGHVFIDVASMYVPGPMWLTVGDPGADGRADAYRAELATSIPAIGEDHLFERGVSGAGFVFAIRRLVSLPKLDVREPGEPGRAHRVATTEAAADVADRFGTLPHLTSWARIVAAHLRRRWPDTDVDLAALPPFTTR